MKRSRARTPAQSPIGRPPEQERRLTRRMRLGRNRSMLDAKQIALIEEAFMLGFMVSREGFNGECDFSHAAPDELKPDPAMTLRHYREYIRTVPEFMRLCALAIRYMENRKDKEDDDATPPHALDEY